MTEVLTTFTLAPPCPGHDREPVHDGAGTCLWCGRQIPGHALPDGRRSKDPLPPLISDGRKRRQFRVEW